MNDNANLENVDIKEKIVEILSVLFENSGVDKDVFQYADLVDDLGMDSISFISLIIELEATFDIQVPDEWLQIEKFQTYKEIYTEVEMLLNEKKTENGNG